VDLLLRTSLLDRVNGELADLLTGRPGSEGILLELEDANAFVISLDPGRTWFRYHHLFADLLRLELRRALPEEVPELHRRAAEWFIQHGWAGPSHTLSKQVIGRAPPSAGHSFSRCSMAMWNHQQTLSSLSPARITESSSPGRDG
jgi:ATP/maltotriose-dependent transcriptional regulator MalT